jgi:hypothetical protein
VIFRQVLAIRRQSEETAGMSQTTRTPFKPSRRFVIVAVVYLGYFLWLINIAWIAHDPLSAAIIAVTMVALGLWNFLQTRGKDGVAIIEASAGHNVLVWGVILLILNWRLDAWLAAHRGISLVEMHRLLPSWIIPVLTLALLVWFGVLMAMTKPKLPHASQKCHA